MDENFLLKTEGARKLYQVAKDLPIVDFHNHLSVAEMAADRQFENLTRLWLYLRSGGKVHYRRCHRLRKV